MPTLIATPGASDANTYATLAEAESLVAGPLAVLVGLGVNVAAWLALASPNTEAKQHALIMAAHRIDRANFLGYPLTDAQARAFPRTDTGIPGVDSVVPDAVKLAQVAEACALLTAPTAAASAAAMGLSSFSLGEKSATLDASARVQQSGNLSSAAETILRNYGLITGRVASVVMPRG